MSKTRNQRATTAAPIKPATTPSLRIDRSAGAIGRAGWTVELDVRSIVAPRETAVFEAAARGFLPFGLRRQPGSGPRRERRGLGPRHTDDRLARIGEDDLAPEGWGRGAGRRHELGEIGVGRGRERDQEAVDPDDVRRALARMALAPAHPERSRRNAREVHAL